MDKDSDTVNGKGMKRRALPPGEQALLRLSKLLKSTDEHVALEAAKTILAYCRADQ